jgi:hypothetical protein
MHAVAAFEPILNPEFHSLSARSIPWEKIKVEDIGPVTFCGGGPRPAAGHGAGAAAGGGCPFARMAAGSGGGGAAAPGLAAGKKEN